MGGAGRSKDFQEILSNKKLRKRRLESYSLTCGFFVSKVQGFVGFSQGSYSSKLIRFLWAHFNVECVILLVFCQ